MTILVTVLEWLASPSGVVMSAVLALLVWGWVAALRVQDRFAQLRHDEAMALELATLSYWRKRAAKTYDPRMVSSRAA